MRLVGILKARELGNRGPSLHHRPRYRANLCDMYGHICGHFLYTAVSRSCLPTCSSYPKDKTKANLYERTELEIKWQSLMWNGDICKVSRPPFRPGTFEPSENICPHNISAFSFHLTTGWTITSRTWVGLNLISMFPPILLRCSAHSAKLSSAPSRIWQTVEWPLGIAKVNPTQLREVMAHPVHRSQSHPCSRVIFFFFPCELEA